jgi:Spy/CpxP family protein refolding chaperone
MRLGGLFAGERIDARSLRAAVAEIARLQGELRAVHLEAHLEMKAILTPGQVEAYDHRRGYGSGTAHIHGKHGAY